jgi:hypothetical protein
LRPRKVVITTRESQLWTAAELSHIQAILNQTKEGNINLIRFPLKQILKKWHSFLKLQMVNVLKKNLLSVGLISNREMDLENPSLSPKDNRDKTKTPYVM